MNNMDELRRKIVEFRDERDWKQFHNPKDLAISLSLEAAEFLEHFQWKTSEEIAAQLKTNKTEIEKELSDVLYYVLLTANDLDIDVGSVLIAKLEESKAKYPVAKAKGNHKKYTELQN